jgi:uncharacterized protein YqgQ
MIKLLKIFNIIIWFKKNYVKIKLMLNKLLKCKLIRKKLKENKENKLNN